MRTLPARLWILSGGIGLVLALMLILWGGNTFLTFPKDNEISQLRSTSQAIRTLSKNLQPTETAINTTPAPPAVEGQAVSQTLISDDFGVPMAMVPAGTFQMGADAELAFTICREFRSDCESDWFEDEEPIHTVSLDDFYIDQYEVTNARYAECVDADICDPPSEVHSQTRNDYYGTTAYDNYPVIYVNWEEAQTYCAWRGARLPTEAEWEKAAAGGIDEPLYPWGDGDPLCKIGATRGAKYDDGSACNGTDTEQVGSFSPNGYGIYDLAGNVWEWVADWYDADYYVNSPSDNPQGPNSGNKRVVRSGSWDYFGYNLRVSNRFSSYPENRHSDLGFRCARDASP
jgi:formylglycine-generating enzyme required for sulfatase activity